MLECKSLQLKIQEKSEAVTDSKASVRPESEMMATLGRGSHATNAFSANHDGGRCCVLQH